MERALEAAVFQWCYLAQRYKHIPNSDWLHGVSPEVEASIYVQLILCDGPVNLRSRLRAVFALDRSGCQLLV
jgi:hypothetical protein